MEYFRDAQVVRLRSLRHDEYLVADTNGTVALHDKLTATINEIKARAREEEERASKEEAQAHEEERAFWERRNRLDEEREGIRSRSTVKIFRAIRGGDEENEGMRRARMEKQLALWEKRNRLDREREAIRIRCTEEIERARRAGDEEIEGMLSQRRGYTCWSVELVANSDSVRLKSYHGNYLTASDSPSHVDVTIWKVLLSPPHLLDSSSELEPMREGIHIKLRTCYETFLCANSDGDNVSRSVAHDLPDHTTILWNVEVIERKGEGSATDVDDKEEGSATDIDGKALEEGYPPKGHHEKGEGSSVTKSPPGKSPVIQESDKVIYRRHFWKLKRLLLDDSGRKDVWVKGGLGTTALIREVCADVRKHFGTIAWISIPPEDCDLIHEEILLQLIAERVAIIDNFENSWMRDHEFPLQQETRCLIIVDHLEDPRTCKKFKEILGIVKTCQVIFIDRAKNDLQREIFSYRPKSEIYTVENLSHVPRAFLWKKFIMKKNYSLSSGEVCRLIVKKCKRLPTAIVFGLRNQRRQYYFGEAMKGEWEARIPSDNLSHEFLVLQRALKTLHKDSYGDEDDDIRRVLEILSGDERRACLLYLSMLPEDRPISCKTVTRLWVAEGLLNNLRRGEDYLDYLLLRKCIQPVKKRSDGEVSTFKVDKRIREIVVSLSDIRDPVTITRPGIKNRPERATYLSVQGTIRGLTEVKSFELSSIFVHDVSSNEDATTTSEALPLGTSETSFFPSEFMHSKVLELVGVSFPIVRDALFKLSKLKYLRLKSSIRAIPGSIKKLECLEFLDAKHSLVSKLPQQAGRLRKIRHILIYHHEKEPLTGSCNLIGFKALCRVKGFKDLEKLCFVEAEKEILEDLGNLTKLRRLGITKLRKEHGEELCTSLGKLEELKSLNLHALDEDEILDLHYPISPPESPTRESQTLPPEFESQTSPLKSQTSLPESKSKTSPPKSKSMTSPSKNLKHLYLHGRLEKLPEWISSSSLRRLTKLILRWSRLEIDPLATLGELPRLVELELHRAYDGERLDFKKGQFPELKILLLEELEGLRSISLEQGTMKSLEKLTISRCPWLESIPSGIRYIGEIQELNFFDMSDELYEKLREDPEHREDQMKEDYKKIKDMKNINF